MKKLILFFVCGSGLILAAGCQPTVATISTTETIAPNGDKTVSTTKILSQTISHMQTTSTDQILEKYK